MTEEQLTRVLDMPHWTLPSHGLRVETVDAHCGGEPLRVIMAGVPQPMGISMLEKRRFAVANFDHLRKGLVHEPRGHDHQAGCLVTRPAQIGSHCGALFFNGAGWGTLSGHGIVSLATILVETGVVPMVGPETRLKIDTPAGMVRAYARVEGDRVRSVFFENTPSFVTGMDEVIVVDGLGEVRYDMAFGGVFYAFVSVEQISARCVPEAVPQLIQAGRKIHAALSKANVVAHPEHPDLAVLGGVVFYDEPPRRRGSTSVADTRHACVFASGGINRSPGGAAVSARLALMLARGSADLGQAVVVESILGTTVTGKAGGIVDIYGGQGVATEVEAASFITGRSTLFIDPADPWKEGFVL